LKRLKFYEFFCGKITVMLGYLTSSEKGLPIWMGQYGPQAISLLSTEEVSDLVPIL
jgi:hypothetical protein